MKRILITGADGFTGRHLINRFDQDGQEIHGLVHNDESRLGSSVHAVHVADLRDYSAVRKIIDDVQPDNVVHLAAIAFVAHGDAKELYSTNILGTRNLLHCLASAPRKPDCVLMASSANVYGNRRAGTLDESMKPEPANDYGITKLTCEELALLYSDRLPIITVRPFNYTGQGQSEKFLIPKIVAHAKARAEKIELGNIDVARDFSDVRAVVDSYARLLENTDAVGGVFNVCSGKARTLAEVIEMVERASGHKMNVEVNPTFVRPDEVKTLCGTPALLERVIGHLRLPPLEDTIAWMLQD